MGKYDANGAFIGSEVVPDTMFARGSLADRAAVADAITETLIPAARDDLEMWIAELSVISPSRADDEMTATLKLEAYARRLADYPADMVRYVLLEKTWRFFPSWFELEDALKPLKRERDAMLAACLRTTHDPRRPEPTEERISAERAAEIMAEAGFKPKTFGGDE